MHFSVCVALGCTHFLFYGGIEMRKIIKLFLVLLCILGMCSCNEKAVNAFCPNCFKLLVEDGSYCPYCGFKVSEDNFDNSIELPNRPKNYSDFDFSNTLGLTEFMGIDSYDFSDKDNAYVVAVSDKIIWVVPDKGIYPSYDIISIGNGYLSHFGFGKNNHYLGDTSKSTQKITVSPYSIVNNNLLKLLDNSFDDDTVELNNIEIIYGIPIFDMSIPSLDNKYYIPVSFLDLENKNITESESTINYEVKFKIKKELLKY